MIPLASGPAVIPADRRFAGFPLSRLWCKSSLRRAMRSSGSCSSCRSSAASTGLGTVGPVGCWPWPALLVAISAVQMTLFYQAQPGTGGLLYVLRLVFGSAMAACLVLGCNAVGRRVIADPRAGCSGRTRSA